MNDARPKQPEHVAVLYNAPTLPPEHPDHASEAGVLEAVEAVETALRSAGRRVSRAAVSTDCRSLCESLARLAPDVVFNLFEGFQGGGAGQGHIAALVELLGLPLTGAGPRSLLLTQDKARCNWMLTAAGVPTPPFYHAARGAKLDRERVGALLAAGPVIVKPACEDASLGIGPGSVTTSLDAALGQSAMLTERYGDVLIERFIAGREFNVAIVGWPRPRLLPLAEIEFDSRLLDHERLVTYDAKWSPGGGADLATPVRCPADVAPELARRIEQVALAAYELTDCRDYARIDVRIDARGEAYVIDVNNNCDISPSAGLVRALGVAGQSHAEFIEELVTAAFARGLATDSHAPSARLSLTFARRADYIDGPFVAFPLGSAFSLPSAEQAPMNPDHDGANPYASEGGPAANHPTSGKATASLVLGITSLLPCISLFAGIPAIIFGALGLGDIARSGGRLRGNGRAITGITTGGISVLMLPIAGILIALLLPAVQAARDAARRNSSMNNLKQTALAIHNYVDSNHHLPAAATRDDAGNPLWSWRVAILPYLDETPLFDAFAKDEPWNGPANQPLVAREPSVYVSPGANNRMPGETHVLAIVDREAAFTPEGPIGFEDIKDGAANTLLAVELQDSGVMWSEPRDLSIDEFIAAMKRQPGEPGPRPIYHAGVCAVFADGSTRLLAPDLHEAVLRSLCTRAGGENVRLQDFD